MGKLDGAAGYLSGAMDYASDNGVEWRRKFIQLAKSNGLKIDLVDPTNKPGETTTHEDKNYQAELKRQGKFKELKQYVSGTEENPGYRRRDLRYVDNIDFMVVMVDPTIPQWGTANEVYVAEDQHKPQFFICEGGLYRMPNWLFGPLKLDDEERGTRCNVFETIEDVIQELILYDNGTIPLTPEWVLIRKHLEMNRDWTY